MTSRQWSQKVALPCLIYNQNAAEQVCVCVCVCECERERERSSALKTVMKLDKWIIFKCEG